MTLGQPLRRSSVLRRVRTALRHAGIRAIGGVNDALFARIVGKGHSEVHELIETVDEILDSVAKERLSPRLVEMVLAIRSCEQKWTKDGRLPQSGQGSFRRGANEVHFPLYRSDKIAQLAAPIEEWREADRVEACTVAQKLLM
jgi:hypothetical protein